VKVNMSEYLKGRAIIYGIECMYHENKRHVPECNDWKQSKINVLLYCVENWNKLLPSVKATHQGEGYYLQNVNITNLGVVANILIGKQLEVLVEWNEIKQYLTDAINNRQEKQLTLLDLYSEIFN
jgi:hypothetical protein